MREVLPLAAAPDHAALARAADALKLHAIEGVRRLVLVDGVFAAESVRSRRSGRWSGRSARCARCWTAGDAALQDALAAPETADAMVALNGAMMTDGVVIEVADGYRADAAAADRPCRQRRKAGGDVHPLAAAARHGRQGDAGRELHRRRVAPRPTRPTTRCDRDRRRRAARACPADRGRPRRLQHRLLLRHARRQRASSTPSA